MLPEGMPAFIRSLVLIASVILSTPAWAFVQDRSVLVEFERVIDSLVQSKKSVGVSAVLIFEGRSHFYSAGSFEQGNGLVLASKETIFELGSVGKTFTTLLLAKTIEDSIRDGGEPMSLESPANVLMPTGQKLPSLESREISLKDLVTHQSALPDLFSSGPPADPLNPYAESDQNEFFDFLGKARLARAPGSQFEYSNVGMALLGLLVAGGDSRMYVSEVDRRILRPLGMNDTHEAVPSWAMNRFSKGHNREGRVTSYWNLGALVGAGGFKTTALDMAAYLKALLNPAQFPSAYELELVQQPLARLDCTTSSATEIGWGWMIGHCGRLGPEAETIRWHTGGTGGFESFVAFDRRRSIGIAILSNQSDLYPLEDGRAYEQPVAIAGLGLMKRLLVPKPTNR